MKCPNCDRMLDIEDFTVEKMCPFCYEILKYKEDDENGKNH